MKFPHLCWNANYCWNCSGLVQTAMLLRFCGYSFAIIATRHNLTTDFLWLLKSFYPSSMMLPESQGQLQVYGFMLGSLCFVFLCVLRSCDFLQTVSCFKTEVPLICGEKIRIYNVVTKYTAPWSHQCSWARFTISGMISLLFNGYNQTTVGQQQDGSITIAPLWIAYHAGHCPGGSFIGVTAGYDLRLLSSLSSIVLREKAFGSVLEHAFLLDYHQPTKNDGNFFINYENWAFSLDLFQLVLTT